MKTDFTPAIRAVTSADVANLNQLENAIASVAENPGETADLLALSASDNTERRAVATAFTLMAQTINTLQDQVASLNDRVNALSPKT